MKYAYINGKILDGTKDMQVKEGFVILTDNDKIEDIVKAGTDLNGYEKVDLKRRYIMPGLINMHVHLAGNGKPQKKQRDNEKLVKILMGNALMRSTTRQVVSSMHIIFIVISLQNRIRYLRQSCKIYPANNILIDFL